jgi:hypothetical protein
MADLPMQPPVPEPTCDYAAEAAAAELVQVLDAYMAELQAGKAPSKAELLAKHPQLASQLEACLAGLEFIHGAETAAPGRQQRLGDFRIIREVGRGGMGAVFEAEQISLRRRVALKILRFASISDPDAIERFKREAQTIGDLHHTNIVPIFAIGEERGVSYYAMQFIEGESLAQVLAESKQPLPADRVAEWGLQAADALSHAHQRGVIHRDVKPSNLILDKQKRLWLTDFGLARRLDDVTLSMTGAILGTPRYMSPEQATSTTKRVDHRTDLFSLGATLYELLTGQPAFSGDSPHEVIQHILTSEPRAIRDFVNSVPRDLETIVMKCLSKDPYDRYAAAADLASDLRAFLDGRPIRARRASAIELLARWMKSQQRSFQLAAAAVAITFLLTIGGLLGWSTYDAWRQGSVKLSTNMPPLVAEFLNEHDEVLRTETLPMQNAAHLPAGDYRVRVDGEKTLSETFDLTLTRGAEQPFSIDLQDQMLWTPQAIERSYELVDFGEELALVHLNKESISLQKRRPPLHHWAMKLESLAASQPEQLAGLIWPWNTNSSSYSGYGVFDTRPWMAPHATDLNGDGTGDLLMAARHQAWLLALSGTNGQVLWFASRGTDVKSKDPNAYPAYTARALSGVWGTPLQHDCNGDGVLDVVATLFDLVDRTQSSSSQHQVKSWVEAISGKDGQTLWSYELPADWFSLPQGEEVPYDLRWFVGGGWGTMGSGGSWMTTGRHRIRDLGRNERTGGHAYRPASVDFVTLDGKQRLAVVAGKRFVSLDVTNGNPGEVLELKSRPARQCQWGDLDGDGDSDMVYLAAGPVTPFGIQKSPSTTLAAWSPQKKAELWNQKHAVFSPSQPGWSIEAPHWPLVVDLNGDGRCEIVLPTDNSKATGRIGLDETPWGAIAVLDGPTGQALWSRQLVTMDQQVNHFIAGPDIDGDGSRELFVATLEGVGHRTHVDALSGKSGATIWHNVQQPPASNNSSLDYFLTPLQWWNAGDDGWPQLVVQIVDNDPSRLSALWTFSAASGRVSRAATGISNVQVADIDRDGVEDLVAFNSKGSEALDLGGQLHCIRGIGREQWQRLGATGDPAADFDGDGVRDLLVSQQAISGQTGRPLWTAQGPEDHRGLQLKVAGGDLNGDGIDDLLAWDTASMYFRQNTPFSAISGRSGRALWTAKEITAQRLEAVLSAESHDLDGDGKPEVLWLAMLDHGYPARNSFSSNENQLWLFVTSGQTGQLRWSQSLSPSYGGGGTTNQVLINNLTLSPCVADADGDGIRDVLVPELLPDTRSFATRVLSGKDGASLWMRPCTGDPNQQPNLANWIPPTAADLDGDGKTEMVFLDIQTVDDAGQPMRAEWRTVAVEGKDGKQRWSTPSGMPVGYWQPHSGYRKSDLLRPRVLRAGKGQRVGMMFPPHNTPARFVVLDADGKVLSTHEAQSLSGMSGLWACDIDGDDVDEAVFLSGEKLCAARSEKMQEPLWTRQIGYAGQQRILDVLTKDGASPVVVVAGDATDNSVQGIDAADGKLAWSCPGPIPRDPKDGVYLMPSHIALLDAGQQAPPRVYYAYSNVSRVRQAKGEVVPRERLAFASVPDQRWQRDLPWARHTISWQSEAKFISWSLAFSAFLVVLPAGYLGYLIWRRRFTLQTLLCLPVVAGLFLTFALMKPPFPDSDFRNFSARLMIGLFLAPAIIGLALLAWWSIRRRWRPIAVWLAISVVVSVIMVIVVLRVESSRHPLLPEESYDWTYWYMIWFAGAFTTSWLMIVVVPLQSIVPAIWRWFRKPKVKLTPAAV